MSGRSEFGSFDSEHDLSFDGLDSVASEPPAAVERDVGAHVIPRSVGSPTHDTTLFDDVFALTAVAS